MNIKKRIALAMLCIMVIIPQTGCSSEEPVSKTEFYLNTMCTISIYNMKKTEAEDLIKKGFDQCSKSENMFSKTIKGSDVEKINKAKGRPVSVNKETLEVVKRGIEYGKLSGGMFDITIGAVSQLWDFNGDNPKVPSKKDIKRALKTVDYNKIQIVGDKVSLKNPKAQMDLGAIAKGYIADEVTRVLKAGGAKQAIVNLGGNIVAIGEKDKGIPWNIGIERPYSQKTKVIGSVDVTDQTIVTSGIYERKFIQNGKLYHHVLSPKTGYPVETGLEAVTVKMDMGKSMDCDAFSTMCLLLGEKKARGLIEERDGVEGIFIDKNDRVTTTKGIQVNPAKE
ncbi:MAG: FAD:protein FMN transferase [Anaerovoracaceae bacterium]